MSFFAEDLTDAAIGANGKKYPVNDYPVSRPELRDVLALIVTYYGEDTVQDVLDSCAAASRHQACRVLVIDNNSMDSTVPLVSRYKNQWMELIRLDRNIGVAAAYNMGVEYACKSGIPWIMILDQDSIYRPSLLERLRASAVGLKKEGKKTGAVCPQVRSMNFPDIIHYPYVWKDYRLIPFTDLRGDSNLFQIDSCLTSGTFYSVEALKDINGFREDYFIDFVDHDAHLRMKRQGWEIWMDRRAELMHRLGKRQTRIQNGLWIEHAPERYYYMARNMSEGLWRQGGKTALLLFLKDTLLYMKRLKQQGDAPWQCCFYIFRGLFDALCGKWGPISK